MPASAAPKVPAADEALLKAYDAFRAGDALKLQRFSSQVGSAHVLAPYLEYWRLKLRIEDAPDAEVQGFLERESGTYVAERLRADWLKELGKRGDWFRFDQQLPLLAQDDLEIRCYGWLARLARADDGAYAEARAMWLEPRELPAGCATLADRMVEAQQISVDDVWARVRVLFENGALGAARRTLGYLPAGERTTKRCSTWRRPRRRSCSPTRRRAWRGARPARWCCSPWSASAAANPRPPSRSCRASSASACRTRT